MTNFKRSLFAAVAAAAPLFATPALAQTEAAAVDEVVVTAQRREQNVQDVPISVSAFSERQLEAANVRDVRDLRRITPSLFIATSPQVSNTRVAIRGIGSSGNTAIEPSVAAFIDGIYVPRVGALLGGLNDVAAVEVLRGPQGTLFGRNASMGALNIRTGQPTREFSALGTLSYGNYDRRRATAVVNAPVGETMAFRVSGLAESFDGFGRNQLDGKRVGPSDTFAIRGTGRRDITPDLTWTLRGDYQHVTGTGSPISSVLASTVTPTARANWTTRLDPDGAGPLTANLPVLDDTFSRRVNQSTAGDLDDRQWGASSELVLSLPDGPTFKLLSGYRDWYDRQYEASAGAVPLPLISRDGYFSSKMHSQELQVLSPQDGLFNGRLSYIAGLYFYHEKYALGETFGLPPTYCTVFLRNTSPPATANARVAQCLAGPSAMASDVDFAQNTTSYAAYGQSTFKITDAWDVTAGIRWTRDDKEGSFFTIVPNTILIGTRAPEATLLKTSNEKVTYRLNTTFKPTDDIMLFATYATGFKSGGFDSGGAAQALNQRRVFRPELTKNLEFGVKSEWLDRKLVANATLFRTDIDDFQFRSYDGISFSTRNSGSIRQQGLEFDVTARPTRNLMLAVVGTRLDSEYRSFVGAPGLPGFGGIQDLTGRRPGSSPKWQGNLTAEYGHALGVADLQFSARTDFSFTSSQNLSAAGDGNPQAIQKGYQELSARLSVFPEDRRWELAVFGANLTDEDYCTGIYAQFSDAAFGLRDAATGGTVQRCVVNAPRTIGVEIKARY
ncbi:TonB-dependent receptor [Phenylobacterium sp.]|uniref:TonB-dependent receptor n=1 Tax=Phenylobacterium sp. TaxID=1871053 RepID=UPI0025E97377|nr:TonB-dependent receptor [Phenylobacterium sp.]